MRHNIIIRVGLYFLFSAVLLTSCTDANSAKKTLKHFGFTPIKVGGVAFFSGSKGDFYNTKFKAVALNGDTVEGVVTKGLLFKGSTIRIKD